MSGWRKREDDDCCPPIQPGSSMRAGAACPAWWCYSDVGSCEVIQAPQCNRRARGRRRQYAGHSDVERQEDTRDAKAEPRADHPRCATNRCGGNTHRSRNTLSYLGTSSGGVEAPSARDNDSRADRGDRWNRYRTLSTEVHARHRGMGMRKRVFDSGRMDENHYSSSELRPSKEEK
jgi:hypothetical protein